MNGWFKLIVVVLVLVAGLSIGYRCGVSGAIEVNTDTIFVRDTIKVSVPIVTEIKDVGLQTYRIKLLGRIQEAPDTIIVSKTDSINIELPIEQKVYSDSAYTAYISGFQPRLDSIHIYYPTRYITTTITEKKRFSYGIQAGVGLTPKGIQPYIGFGLQYNF